MSLTKDEITRDAIIKLRAGGARVRKVHNVSAYKKRKGQVEPGISDIEGYTAKGIIVMCEVKTENDKLSQPQIERLMDCTICGGLTLLATEKNGSTVLTPFKETIFFNNAKPLTKYLK